MKITICDYCETTITDEGFHCADEDFCSKECLIGKYAQLMVVLTGSDCYKTFVDELEALIRYLTDYPASHFWSETLQKKISQIRDVI